MSCTCFYSSDLSDAEWQYLEPLLPPPKATGRPRQKASVADLIFDVPELISVISAGITLLPGDIIATGTPAGVGIGFDPPKFLRRGDRVRIQIEGIGTLSNPVQ